MSNYYVSLLANNEGAHSVHRASCSQFPDFEDVISLGNFTHVQFAIRESKKIFPTSAACEHCMKVTELEEVS